MGLFFGDGHFDDGDDDGGMTVTYQDGTLEPEYEPGRFHLFYFGVWARTDNRAIIGFSGRRRHGGTPPLAPEGVNPDPSVYRLMHVLYPPAAMLSGAGVKRLGLASIPGANGMELFTMPPEMTTPL